MATQGARDVAPRETVFIIAHRLSIVGRVIEEGTHHQLLARRGLYLPIILKSHS